jgi:hypothetical protein
MVNSEAVEGPVGICLDRPRRGQRLALPETNRLEGYTDVRASSYG